MSDPSRSGSIVTPEGVALTPDIAGLGSRMIATIIDTLIQSAVIIALTIPFGVAGLFDSTPFLVVYLVVVFVTVWGYFPLFEGLWNGRTPGKRAQRLRVVQDSGQPLSLGPLLVRNIVRLIDFLPAYYAIGAATILLTRKSQRLGDLAAGTVVVREHAAPAPAALTLEGEEASAEQGPAVDTARLSEHQYDLVRSFLERRESLAPDARAALAAQFARSIRPVVGGGERWPESNETFLEAVFRSYRRRFADRMPPPPEAPITGGAC
jgi:uncharacterized RDD family membrane protein YckC